MWCNNEGRDYGVNMNEDMVVLLVCFVYILILGAVEFAIKVFA